MTTRYRRDSGFVARNGGPDRKRPRDWIVWHFTHVSNLPSIVTAGRLLPDGAVSPPVNVAYDEVKERRRRKLVDPDTGYPMSMVSDHVPFYIAARSPMLYVVHRGHAGYSDGVAPLVHLGVFLGDIIDANLTWCASDGNAGSGWTKFSREIGELGTFVDFDLLCQYRWNNTDEDTNRQSRRAAEILVHGHVPLELVSWVCCCNEKTMTRAKTVLGSVGGVRDYVVKPEMFYL